MYSQDGMSGNIPEWYRLEKETGKVISKLVTVKDLNFYLKHPDEFIRRLAILRLSELRLKESVDALKEVMEDHLESTSNRELAAWAIKGVCRKWDIELFISGRLLSKYSGNEKLNDLCGIFITDDLPAIKFDFTAALIDTELKMDSTDIRQSQDINFSNTFPFKEWFKAFSSGFAAAAWKTTTRLPQILLKGLLWFIMLLFVKAPRLILKWLTGVFKKLKYKRQLKRTHAAGILSRSAYTGYKTSFNPFIPVKKAIFYILYAAFFPLRLVLRHAGVSAGIIVILYIFLAYTSQGKLIANRYINIDIIKAQTRVYSAASEILTYAWDEFKDITGIGSNDYSVTHEEAQVETDDTAAETQRLFRVTARTGLNLRKAPGKTSEKVMEKMLANDTVLNFLSKEEKDSSGETWLYVSTPDGKVGWVSARWIEELGGEKID